MRWGESSHSAHGSVVGHCEDKYCSHNEYRTVVLAPNDQCTLRASLGGELATIALISTLADDRVVADDTWPPRRADYNLESNPLVASVAQNDSSIV